MRYYRLKNILKRHNVNIQLLGLLIIILSGFFIRIFWLDKFGLVADEAYYFLWSINLDYSYHDHPAGIALIIFLSRIVFGSSEFGIRLLNSLINVLTAVLGYYFVSTISNSTLKGTFTAIWLTFSPFMLILGIFTFPDSLMLFFFFLTLITWHKVMFESKSILFMVIPTILFMNTKYNAYFVVISLVIAYLWYKKDTSKSDIIIIIFTLILGFLPVLVWNYLHNWSSFIWQFNHLIYGVGSRKSLLTKILEILHYFSLPVVIFSLLGFISIKSNNYTRWLVFISLTSFIPSFFSSLDSARNLLLSVIPLLLASSIDLNIRSITPKLLIKLGNFNIEKFIAILFIALILFNMVLLNLYSFQSNRFAFTNYDSIIIDSKGFDEISISLRENSFDTIVTPDYGLAGQLQYYLPEYHIATNWPQYIFWGLELEENLTVVSFSSHWQSILQNICQELSETQEININNDIQSKTLYYWNCNIRLVDQDEFLSTIDYGLL